MTHEIELSPVRPNIPEVKKPVVASPMVIAAGTMTGLKSRKSGIEIIKPITEPARSKPAMASSEPTKGTPTRKEITFQK